MKAINDAHQAEYSVKPEVVVRAPCRFHLIGEHSWFFKDKAVSMAVNLPVYVAASKRSDSVSRFYFVQLNDRKKAGNASLKFKKEDKWANVLKAILYGYMSGGFELGGLDFTVYSEILPSAGFGVTTAIKAAALLAIKRLFDLQCSEPELLQVMERANRRFLQMNNYLADNFSALFARRNNLIITDYTSGRWDYAPFDFPGKKILLIDTRVPRVSVWSENSLYEPHNALLLGDLRESKPNVFGGWQYITNITDINEVLDVVSEDTRRKLMAVLREHSDVLEARDGAEKRDFFKFARAVNRSHESMRDFYNISCPEIDWILKRVNELEPNLEMVSMPVSCGRITGKGFGRCLYVIIRESDADKFKARLGEFEKIFGYHAECYEVVPSDGAAFVVD